MTSFKKRSAAAKKANATRKARNARRADLESRFSPMTADVVLAVETGDKKELEMLRGWYGITSVAAILANHTRGTYGF